MYDVCTVGMLHFTLFGEGAFLNEYLPFLPLGKEGIVIITVKKREKWKSVPPSPQVFYFVQVQTMT